MRKVGIILIILVLLVFVGYKYVYHDHRNIKEETAEFQVTATRLLEEFNSDPSQAEQKYLNKTIAVTGPVSNSINSSITLNGNVFCQFSDSLTFQPKIGDTLKIKGRFIGYDDLLEEIKLDQSSVIQ